MISKERCEIRRNFFMDKLTMHTPNLADENYAKLADKVR